ncbi:MAG: response regulator [Patescibacteria group bacterium]
MRQIIIVDDEEDVRKILTRMILKTLLVAESDTLSFERFERSDEAWDRISKLPEKPDIVFSSVDMDGQSIMNGLDLLAATKGKFPDVIFVSTSGTPSYRGEAIEKGADHFLAKPLSQADIEKIFA